MFLISLIFLGRRVELYETFWQCLVKVA